ncbi:MAG: four helix bundle protein [Flavobacteriales bacterium]|nr:four helix bundle protein [Flavobacteriales bacterium]
MKKENPALDKSYAFALKVVKLSFKIQEERKEYVLSKQLLRSATSIGANTEEAIGAQSDKDFLHKISIAYKEARESHYWIRLMGDSELIVRDDSENLLLDVEEILRILGSIQKTLKQKLQ